MSAQEHVYALWKRAIRLSERTLLKKDEVKMHVGIGTYAIVLAHEPRLERGEENGGGRAAEQSANHQDPEVGKMLRHARRRVEDRIEQAVKSAATAIE